ncbi:MAG: hypothetical protein H6705_00955 [Myxococcales bacterium]|nr:hypothetical protein [Myxococcales bacterium]
MMRRAFWLAACLAAGFFWPALAAAEPEDGDAPEPAAAAPAPIPDLPDDPQVAEAREAYNAGRYKDAAAAFAAIARRHPRDAAVYRAWARAASWAAEPAAAVRAYRHYLALAPSAGDADKVKAELGLVLRKLDKPPAEGPPAAVAAGLATVRERVAADRFAGPEGALAALAKLEAGDYVGPELADARALVDGGLGERSATALADWWAPDKKVDPARLAGLAAGWAARAKAGALPYADQRTAAAIAGLDHLVAGRHAAAIETLAPVAPGDPRLRYAQAVALALAERHAEAEQLLAAMLPDADDRRVVVLLGLVRRAQGRIDHALEAWRAALEPPAGDRR